MFSSLSSTLSVPFANPLTAEMNGEQLPKTARGLGCDKGVDHWLPPPGRPRSRPPYGFTSAWQELAVGL